MTQHASLSGERWRRFTFPQQILSIAAEMERAALSISRARSDAVHASYERVLRMADLSIQCADRRSRRRELLIWRDLIGQLYLEPELDPAAHSDAFRALLRFTPESSRQIPHVTLG